MYSICQQILKIQQCPENWKGQFSFQYQSNAMPKNVQIAVQLHSFHMLARLCSKSFKLGFSNMWTNNFQMYKLELKSQRNQKSNCEYPLDHRKNKEIPIKTFYALSPN